MTSFQKTEQGAYSFCILILVNKETSVYGVDRGMAKDYRSHMWILKEMNRR